MDAFIVSAVRSPIGRFGGAFRDVAPPDLAAPVMRAALGAAGVGADQLDLVVFGNVLRGGHGQLVPRQAAFKAGIPEHVDAMAIDMVCSSGMAALLTGLALIRSGEAEVIMTGGVESMSTAGFALDSRARWGLKYLPGDGAPLIDLMARDGLSDPVSGEAMGEQTERLAKEEGVGRPELDEVAAWSHQRAAAASTEGRFAAELVDIGLGKAGNLAADEGVRPEATKETLGALRPAFRPDGVLTAGNSSQISDGAAALVLASERAVAELGLEPLATVSGSSWAAGEPYRFPEAPVPAIERLLERLGRQVGDFDLFENNEAFALNSILLHRRLDISFDQLNVNGGAIALGHPIGCSGARIVVTLIHALRARKGASGIASICHGTGGGTAMAVDLI
jgi:acetyl-CoA C-acetyltransferase